MATEHINPTYEDMGQRFANQFREYVETLKAEGKSPTTAKILILATHSEAENKEEHSLLGFAEIYVRCDDELLQ